MTKTEAIVVMNKGKKVTHTYFSHDEWMTIKNGEIVFEDGGKCSQDEFWKDRTTKEWEDGYTII